MWQPCLCKTIPTCGNPYPSDCEDLDCGAGCACPPERHILWNNQCITIEQCPEHKINRLHVQHYAYVHLTRGDLWRQFSCL